MSHRPNQIENYEIQQQYNPRTDNFISDMKDILLRFLRDLFYQRPVGSYHYEAGAETGSTDEKISEILISDGKTINTDSVEKRPIIILSRSPFAWGNLTLDNLVGRELETAKMHHSDLVSGSFIINCISRSGLEAENIAVLIFDSLRFFRTALQRAGFFSIGHMVQIGEESPAGALVGGDSAEDYVVVPVSFPVYYQRNWSYEKVAEVLAVLEVQLAYIASHYDGDILIPGSIDSDGMPVPSSPGIIISTWTLE